MLHRSIIIPLFCSNIHLFLGSFLLLSVVTPRTGDGRPKNQEGKSGEGVEDNTNESINEVEFINATHTRMANNELKHKIKRLFIA